MSVETVIQFEGTIYENGYGLVAQSIMRDKTIPKQSKVIYAYMCSFASIGANGERTAFPSVSLQCDELSMSEDTYYKWRKVLLDRGLIKIRKERSENGMFNKNIYSIVAIPQPPEKKSEPNPKNSGTDNPYPNSSSTEYPSTDNSGTNNTSSNSTSSNNKDLDTVDTNSESYPQKFTDNEKQQKKKKEEYLNEGFINNSEVIPPKLANMLDALTKNREEAEHYYNIILIAKKNVEKKLNTGIIFELNEEVTEKVIHSFSRGIRRIERERDIKDKNAYLYSTVQQTIHQIVSAQFRRSVDSKFSVDPHNLT